MPTSKKKARQAASSAKRPPRRRVLAEGKPAGQQGKGGGVSGGRPTGREPAAANSSKIVGATAAAAVSKSSAMAPPAFALEGVASSKSAVLGLESLVGSKPGAGDDKGVKDVERTFGDFLAEIGGAYAKAMDALDRQSAEYLASGARPLPCVFRIPRLSAEMKFALEERSGTGLNVLVYHSSSGQTELNQQSMSFEIVAAPPPPGLAVAAPLEAMVGPRWDLIALREARERLLAVGDTRPDVAKALGLTPATYGAAKPRLVVWQILPPAGSQAGAGGGGALYAFGYHDGAEPAIVVGLALVLLQTDAGGALSLVSATPLRTSAPDPTDRSLASFLRQASDWQEKLLKL